MQTLQQVVLTGMGAVTARGDWTLRQCPDLGSPYASGAIANFDLVRYLDSQKNYLDRASALALAGSALALRDAGVQWPLPEGATGRFGIALGTHLGCLETMRAFWDKACEKGMRMANPLLFSHSYYNSPISLCAIEFGLKGYHTTAAAGDNSGLAAISAACDAIALGHADAMLCGGVDALTPTRQQCLPAADASEAAVFFVLEAADAAGWPGAIAIDTERLSTQAAFHADLVRSTFGDCAGANSALAVALTLRSNFSLTSS